jgi:hypothetical protein
MDKLPSTFGTVMSAKERQASLKKRSADDNTKHMNARVDQALSRSGKGKSSSLFNPSVQADLSKKHKS